MAYPRADPETVPRFGLIGCGRIGSLYDEESGAGPALSVASAICRSPGAELAAVCDLDPERARSCARRRDVTAHYTDWSGMLAREALDGVAICTPPALRMDAIKAALAAGVAMIWCEKPVAESLAEARAIGRLIGDSEVVFAVDYLRRWAPVTEHVRTIIAAGDLGRPQSAALIYGGGVANNASHFIDLMARLIGPALAVRALRTVPDGRDAADPTLDAVINCADGEARFPFYLWGTDHRELSLCELDLRFTAGRIRLLDWGNVVEIYRAAANQDASGDRPPILFERIDGALDDALEQALAQILRVHSGAEQAPLCQVGDGIAALEVVDSLLRSSREDGAAVTVQRSGE